MDYVHHIHRFPPVCRQRPLKNRVGHFQFAPKKHQQMKQSEQHKKKEKRLLQLLLIMWNGATQTVHPLTLAADVMLWPYFTWLGPHHFYWGFCAAGPAGFCWAVPSGPPSCPALAGVGVRTPRTEAAPASPRPRLQSYSPALSASPCPVLPLPPPRLPPPPLPRRGLPSWALPREARVPPRPHPRRPPLLSGLRPLAGTHRPVRRKRRRPRNPGLLWAVRSSRRSGPRSSCSYQERSEAGEINQSGLRDKSQPARSQAAQPQPTPEPEGLQSSGETSPGLEQPLPLLPPQLLTHLSGF